MHEVIKNFPARIPLAVLPTPIQPLKRISSLTAGIDIFIKCDDLTGCALSGNKARKLEFILADAQRKNSTILITCGGIQSNHARSSAIAGAQLGMKSLLVLRGAEPASPEANLVLDLLVGAKIKYVTAEEYFQSAQIMSDLAEELKQTGETPYIIPEGGSNALGSLGYAMAIAEIKDQLEEPPDYIVTAVGSGGTMAGLVMGAQLFDLPSKIIGINICANATLFKKRVANIIQEARENFGLPLQEEGNWDIIDGYPGLGYAQTRPEEVEILKLVAKKEGVILDPVYTVKAFYGLLEEAKKGRFGTNKKVVFIHTGGIFGLLTQNYTSTLFVKD